jgi:starch phosphorylase
MRRQVRDYSAGMYTPAALHGAKLRVGGGAPADELAAWKRRIRERWDGVRILEVSDAPRDADSASPLRMQARIQLSGLTPGDLRVEFKARRLLPDARFELAPLCSFGHGQPKGQWLAEFAASGSVGVEGAVTYDVAAVPPGTGQYQLEVRVYPWHPLLSHPLEMGLMKSL